MLSLVDVDAMSLWSAWGLLEVEVLPVVYPEKTVGSRSFRCKKRNCCPGMDGPGANLGFIGDRIQAVIDIVRTTVTGSLEHGHCRATG
jgi:hypothetical protein